MERGEEVSFDFAEFEQTLGELGSELCATVRDDVSRQAMESCDVAQEKSCCLLRCDCRGGGREMCHLGESIYTDINCVISLGGGKLDDEVH